jgi:hypothetical protein
MKKMSGRRRNRAVAFSKVLFGNFSVSRGKLGWAESWRAGFRTGDEKADIDV